MPGAGATASSFVAYNEARRWSKRPELFGKGSMEGVAAPETANNAVQGGDLVPTLALGIPGSNSAAIMLAALILHGIQPGPFLLSKHPQLVYTLFAGLLIVNLLMIPVGLVILRLCLLALLCLGFVSVKAQQTDFTGVWTNYVEPGGRAGGAGSPGREGVS